MATIGRQAKQHSLKYLTPNHFRALRGMSLIAVGERERTPRPSWRVALSNDTLRDPVRLRRSLRRCAANRLEVSFTFYCMGGNLVIIENFKLMCMVVRVSVVVICMHVYA